MSKFLSLTGTDILKGFLMAALGATTTALYQVLSSTPMHFPTGPEFEQMGLVGLAAGASYLVKNFFTNSEGQAFKKEK